MNRKFATILGLQALIIIVLAWLLTFYGKDEFEALTQKAEEEIDTPHYVQTEKSGLTVITVNTATQQQSEINTSALAATAHQLSISSYGSVINIDGLIELRTRYLAAKADAEVLRTSLNHNRAEFKRLQSLNLDDKNVSDKVVAAALANVKADEAKIVAAESGTKNIADSMRQTWGEVLTQQATQTANSPLLQALISNKEVLLQTTLPFDAAEPEANSKITIAPTAAPSHTVQAHFVSRAPTGNNTIQGKTYFYTAASPELRAGMQINALSAKSNQASDGVIIPNAAIVWYAGKPWVYQKTSKETFSRIAINTDIELENGWFYQGKLKAGDLVVTSGAQLLLSEEFKSQITNENDD